MDVLVTLTFQTIIPFVEDIDISEVTVLDALDQLSDEARADLIDSWTLVGFDATSSNESEE